MSARFFVAGTDTGVGKTEVACALLRLMARAGEGPPFAFKPYESGVVRGALRDSARLWEAAGKWQPRQSVGLHAFAAPLAPGVAAELEGRRPSWAKTLAAFRKFRGPGVVEGAGGLLVPLDSRHDVVDLIEAVRLPVVLVARAGLGTVNHTSLSLEALRARRLEVAAVVLVRGARGRDASVPHNRRVLERRFPGVKFVGPVAFASHGTTRAKAFDAALGEVVG